MLVCFLACVWVLVRVGVCCCWCLLVGLFWSVDCFSQRTVLTFCVDVCVCVIVSVVVCWHVLFPGDAMGLSGGCLGGV